MPRPVPIHTTAGITTRDMIDMLVQQGALKITRCPPGRPPRDTSTRGRKGGAIPSYLNPLFMGETREEFEANERERARG
jgi:hypothetical protein